MISFLGKFLSLLIIHSLVQVPSLLDFDISIKKDPNLVRNLFISILGWIVCIVFVQLYFFNILIINLDWKNEAT